jgi:hypothetical protein
MGALTGDNAPSGLISPETPCRARCGEFEGFTELVAEDDGGSEGGAG